MIYVTRPLLRNELLDLAMHSMARSSSSLLMAWTLTTSGATEV